MTFQKGGTASSQVLIFDTTGIDFLSEELLLEIFHVIRTLMLKKSRILKEFGSVSFCFIVLGVKLCWWVFLFIEKNISFPQEAFVDLAAPVYRFLILQLLEIFCNHDF